MQKKHSGQREYCCDSQVDYWPYNPQYWPNDAACEWYDC